MAVLSPFSYDSLDELVNFQRKSNSNFDKIAMNLQINLESITMCMGWIVSPNRYVEVLTLVPHNVTLFAKRVIVDITRFKMKANWNKVGP